MTFPFPDAYLRILESGRPLAEINPGSNEVALTRGAALAAIAVLNDTQVAILGGDVLIDDGSLHYAYANWYSLPRETETPTDFARRSQLEAATYIRGYPSRHGPEPLFVLVCTGPPRRRGE